MPTPTERILDQLETADCRPRRAGRGYQARCPAHDDRTPSLHLTEGADERVLIKCWAGCDTTRIVQALGLELKDLFVQRDPDELRAVPPRLRQRVPNTERAHEDAQLADWARDRDLAEQNDAAIDAAAWITNLAEQAVHRNDRHLLAQTLRALGEDAVIIRTAPHHAYSLIRARARDHAYDQATAPLLAALAVLDPEPTSERAAS